jgi:hypothetical protein
MKNNIIKKSLVCLTALVMASGCSDDFLTSDIQGKLAASEFYKTDEDAVQATTSIYSMMQAHYFSGWNSFYLVKTLPSDESNAGGSGPSDQPGYQALDNFTHDAQNPAVAGSWRMSYYAINRANQVVNRVLPETTLRKRLIAEAKALRAYNYLELVSLWGDVPVILEDLPPSEWTNVKRQSKEAVYAQIAKDLTEAIPDLPLKSEYSAGDRFRISKGTAQAILGKAYLFNQNWGAAAEQFDAVINSGQYNLESDFGAIFSNAGEFGRESIFEIAFTEQAGYDWGTFPWDNGANGRRLESNIHIQLMGPRSDFYTKAPQDSLVGGWGFNTPTDKLYKAFVNAGDTARRKHTVMSEAELKAKGGNWTAPDAYDYEGYFQRKYSTYSNYTNAANGAVPDLNYGTNWRLIRYADVLLMAAEAHHRASNDGRAIVLLNQVRERAKLTPVIAAGDALFQAIMNERLLELAFEGFRYVDLVRWGKAAQEIKNFQANKHELLPIPDNDVKTAGLTPNPGY